MRLFLMTLLTLCAFAANSLLTRAALVGEAAEPLVFAAIRVAAGAGMLGLLLRVRGRRRAEFRLVTVLALATYMLGFSLAYLHLTAGAGALLLFGGVQVTMFAGAVATGEPLPAQRILGAILAFAGLVWLLLPAAGAVSDLVSALSMLAAAAGWGIYSLAGRRAADPLAATAANFLFVLPLMALPLLFGAGVPTLRGVGLAVTSGALTSGLGYALWYALVPELGAGRAAVAQMAVPVIAMAGGLALLGEAPGLATLGAMVVVLAGVALAMLRRA